MKNLVRYAFAALLVAGASAPLQAQQGFALKGHYLFNSSKVKGTDSIPAHDGFSVGAEYVLPLGIGVGLSGYTTGNVTDANRRTTEYGVLAEANYFLKLPVIPVSPYVGVNAGLGHYTVNEISGAQPELKDSKAQLGFQVGARLQLTHLLGVDAQYRRVSQSSADSQDPHLERNQVLVGVTLF
ncbi:MAG TPA: outer membrane beta-barrel protein [Longimicrobiaceae bacterium]|nr:outer membrane beta-barrel protein [Longimicrobiaceae bacterium]